MTDSDILAIAEKHSAYKDAGTVTLRGAGIVECVREVLAVYEAERWANIEKAGEMLARFDEGIANALHKARKERA